MSKENDYSIGELTVSLASFDGIFGKAMMPSGGRALGSSELIRWGGIGAVLGSILGILVSPIITSAYSFTEDGAGQNPPWEPVLSDLLGPLFGFASPDGVYATYGKMYFVVFLSFLLGLIALRTLQGGSVGRLGHWGFRLSLTGVVLNLFGNIPDYWFGEDTWFEALGFFFGTVLGLLLLLAGSTMLGIALLRAGTMTRLGAWLLILSLPGIVLLTLAGFGNIPSGPALWFSLAWLVLGYALWTRGGTPDERFQDTG